MNVSSIFDSKVDEAWYSERYRFISTPEMSPDEHYHKEGRAAGHFPNRSVECIALASIEVDQDWYKKEYPDVASTGMDPRFHFAVFGKAEGRRPNSTVDGIKCTPIDPERIQIGAFDPAFYLRLYQDVAQSGCDPKVHYDRYGKHEGRFINSDSMWRQIHKYYRPYIDFLFPKIVGRRANNDDLIYWSLCIVRGLSFFETAMQISETAEAKAFQHRLKKANLI